MGHDQRSLVSDDHAEDEHEDDGGEAGQGEDIVLDVALAARVLEPGADAEAVLAAADADLIPRIADHDPTSRLTKVFG